MTAALERQGLLKTVDPILTHPTETACCNLRRRYTQDVTRADGGKEQSFAKWRGELLFQFLAFERFRRRIGECKGATGLKLTKDCHVAQDARRKMSGKS